MIALTLSTKATFHKSPFFISFLSLQRVGDHQTNDYLSLQKATRADQEPPLHNQKNRQPDACRRSEKRHDGRLGNVAPRLWSAAKNCLTSMSPQEIVLFDGVCARLLSPHPRCLYPISRAARFPFHLNQVTSRRPKTISYARLTNEFLASLSL